MEARVLGAAIGRPLEARVLGAATEIARNQLAVGAEMCESRGILGLVCSEKSSQRPTLGEVVL